VIPLEGVSIFGNRRAKNRKKFSKNRDLLSESQCDEGGTQLGCHGADSDKEELEEDQGEADCSIKRRASFSGNPTTGFPMTGSSLKEVDMLPYLYTHKTHESCIWLHDDGHGVDFFLAEEGNGAEGRKPGTRRKPHPVLMPYFLIFK
jgi:hypothetical protein